MRTIASRWAGVAILGASVLVAGLSADEPSAGPSAPRLQKAITHPLAKALVGTWSTKMTGRMTGSGTATFALGVGDTCLIQDERSEHSMPGGGTLKGAGHGIYRIGDDGKSIKAWWIDNMEPEVVEVAGTITDTGFDMSGEASKSGRFRIVLEKTATGFLVRSYMGDAKDPIWTQTYERVAGP